MDAFVDLVPVRVLYLFDAASNIAVKLVAEGLVV